MKYSSKIPVFCLCVVFLAGCSSQAVYNSESFAIDSPFKLKVDSDVATACEGARRSLLGQGYLIESSDSEGVKARKSYKSRDDQNTFIEMTIVCLPETRGSTLFATGVVSAYALKKSTSSASVGLSALGSISLPIGQSADSLVKVSEETINDKEFYRRFFASIDNALDEMRAGQAAPDPVAIPPATGSGAVETAAAVVAEPATEPPAPAGPAPLAGTGQAVPVAQPPETAPIEALPEAEPAPAPAASVVIEPGTSPEQAVPTAAESVAELPAPVSSPEPELRQREDSLTVTPELPPVEAEPISEPTPEPTPEPSPEPEGLPPIDPFR